MRRVRDNTLYNVVGAVVPLVVTFVTLPFYLRAIGEERYGILAILWMLLSYFGLFDAGLGRAAAQQVAKRRAEPAESSEGVFWTALGLNLGLGALGGVLLWLFGGLLLTRVIVAPAALSAEVMPYFGWIALAVPITTASAVLVGTLQGLERFVAINALRVADQALNQLLPLAVAQLFSPHLGWLIVSVVVMRLLSALGSFALCVRYLPLRHAPRMERSHIQQLLTYGGWVTVTSIVSPLLTTIDRVVIGALAGTKAVAYYTVPYSLASRIAVLPGSLSSALFPRFSAGTDAERDLLMNEGVRAVLVAVTPAVVAGVLIMRPFLRLWVGPEFAEQAATPGQIIALGLWFNSLAFIAFTRLQAQGQPQVAAKFHLLELVPYLALLWVAVNAWGIVGAALAWSVRVAADAALLFGAAPLSRQTLGRMLAPLVMLAAAAAVVFLPATNALIYWTSSAAIFSGSVVWAWRAAPLVMRQMLERVSIGLLRRRAPKEAGQ